MSGTIDDPSSFGTGRPRPFLLALPASDAAELQRRVVRRHFGPGEILLREGVFGDSAALLLEGRVKLLAGAPDGREVVLAMLGPGELLGEMSAIDGGQRTASVVALTTGCAGFLDACELREFISERPIAGVVLMRTLIRRLREADRARVEQSAHDGVGRVAIRLLELAELYGERVTDGVRIDLLLTQDELASWTGASRETVARVLRLMRQLGWVATSRRSITVRDVDALRARVAVA